MPATILIRVHQSDISCDNVSELLEANGITDIIDMHPTFIKQNSIGLRIKTAQKKIQHIIVRKEEEDLRLYIRTNISLEV